MSVTRRMLALLLVPPVAVCLPLALMFLTRVLRVEGSDALRIWVAAYIAYTAASAVAAALLLPSMNAAKTALETADDPSEALSHVLHQAVVVALFVWVIWGGVLALIAAAVLKPSIAGVHYFAEAVLIVAAPAMAWTYWGGKHMLLSASRVSSTLRYRGRVYSIRTKISMVFIGFFVVSTGALVQLVSSEVEGRLTAARVPVGTIPADLAVYGLIIAVITAAIFSVATWFLARDITQPINTLKDLAQRMAEGRFDSSAVIFSDDEVGQLAESFSRTGANLRALIARVGDSGATIAEGVRSMNSGTATLLSSAHEQMQLTSDASAAVLAVRNEAQSILGAVEQVAEVTSLSATGALRLNTSSAEVARRAEELFESVEKTTSATTQVEASARELTERTGALSAVSSEVLAFVTEMEAAVAEIRRTAEATAELSADVRDSALAGREAVDATVQGLRSAQESTRRTAGAFHELQKSLLQIDQILVFIDEVTNRTNLLSLNAAIIAAQAGANDFGFSVIAGEVRELADRTRGATKEIAGIIRAVQPIASEAVAALGEGVGTVDRTVELAHDAVGSLATILENAGRSLEMVQSISVSLQEQSQASRHLQEVTATVSDNISEMCRATRGQETATMLLAGEAERVRDIALHVKRATNEQLASGGDISAAMAHIADDVRVIRDRLERQLENAEQISKASRLTLTIAERNNKIAQEFDRELGGLLQGGEHFEHEVAQFRL